MKTSDFWRAVIAGFFATYVMSAIGAWEKAIGIPPHESIGLLATTPVASIDFYLNGIVLTLIYARWIHGLFNWHPLIVANLYGLVLVFVAMGILVPLHAPEVGFFAFGTGQGLKFTLGSVFARIAYGTVLALFYLPEERT